MTSSTLALVLCAFLLLPNMTKVPEVTNQTPMQSIFQSFQLEYESIGDTILDKAGKKISNLHKSRLLEINIDVRTSRVRHLANKASRLFKQLPIN